jgi:hypothetical protein
MFCFAGRRPNMELQLPFVRRILAENPDVEYHIWNLARDHDDNLWLRTITGKRITVFSEHYGVDPWKRFDEVYRHYATDGYRGHLFVKLDDDVVFLETRRFGCFLNMVEAHRDSVISAQVVNNGACTRLTPGLWAGLSRLHIPLLDVHKNHRYAAMCHLYFAEHWSDMIDQPVEPRRIDDWLSINAIGYDWNMAKRFAELLGTPSPRTIAGRSFNRLARLGDEGMVNTLPRVMCQGFVAAHLTFGPQEKLMAAAHLNDFRARYAEIGEKYLTGG